MMQTRFLMMHVMSKVTVYVLMEVLMLRSSAAVYQATTGWTWKETRSIVLVWDMLNIILEATYLMKICYDSNTFVYPLNLYIISAPASVALEARQDQCL